MRPSEAWALLRAGNERFVAGTPSHPHQDVARRHELLAAQRPVAALFGCSDSRLAAEIIFDLGLGDLFAVRNAGQVPGESIIGSLEYAVAMLHVPLLVVLGHDECGAVRAAIDSTTVDAPMLPPAIWRQISPIVPAVREAIIAGRDRGVTAENVPSELVGKLHLRNAIEAIMSLSSIIRTAVEDGTLAIVGANYRLSEGTAVPDVMLGLDGDPSNRQ